MEYEAVVADALYDSVDNRRVIHEEKTRDGESVEAYIPSRRREKSEDGKASWDEGAEDRTFGGGVR